MKLRILFQQPMVVTSCCRSKEYNRRIRGHPRSLHVYDTPHWNTGGCMAIDIFTPNGSYAWQLDKIAKNEGWSIGRGVDFIHLDRRVDIGLDLSFFGYGR